MTVEEMHLQLVDTYGIMSQKYGHMYKGDKMVKNSKNTELIVSTGMQLMRKRGYSAVSVRDICEEAGVSHSSFYNVFSGKDDILLYILKGQKDNYEVTMEQLLDADNPVEKLWILLSKYLDLPEMFGPDLTSVLMQMDLQGRFGLEEAVLDFVGRYYKWFLRFAKECQQDGIIQTPGDLQRLVEFGVELTFYTVSQWCSSGGSFPLRPRVYEKMEDFYVIAPEYRGLWKKEPGTPEEYA